MSLIVDMVLQCTNSECPEFEISKNASLQQLTTNVYAQPRIVCTCGYEMWLVGPQVSTT